MSQVARKRRTHLKQCNTKFIIVGTFLALAVVALLVLLNLNLDTRPSVSIAAAGKTWAKPMRA